MDSFENIFDRRAQHIQENLNETKLLMFFNFHIRLSKIIFWVLLNGKDTLSAIESRNFLF